MELFILCHTGAEPALERELKQLDVTGEKLTGGMRVTVSEEKAAEIVFASQVAIRVLVAVATGDLDTLDITPAENHIPEDSTFGVHVETYTEQELPSVDIAAKLGEQISRKVNLSKPDCLIFCAVHNQAICGIDIAGDLSKRYYRAFTNRISIKGTFAASLLFLHETSGGIVDPFANTGEIAIEAAMRSTNTSARKFLKHQKISLIDEERKKWTPQEKDAFYPVWCFDPQLGNLRSCKKNAKLAAVEKSITFSKLDPEWMDVKFEEGEVGAIVTIPPQVTQRVPDDDHIKELCYQAAYVLKDKGVLVVACATKETESAVRTHAKAYKLVEQGEHVVFMGKKAHTVLCYGM